MLTRELLRFGRQQGRILPRFVDKDNQSLRALAEELIGLYTGGIGQSSEDLAELATPVVNAFRSPQIAKGINKLLQDRCTFAQAEEGLEDWRQQVFAQVGRLAPDPQLNDLSAFRQAVGAALGMDPDRLGERLYADLPLRLPLEAFRNITADEVLERYNLAQVQGLLLRALDLEVTLTETDVGRRRVLLGQMRFQRLLGRIHSSGDNALRLSLSGPLSLFEQTQKYGLQLALFFPWLCLQPHWKLSARIRLVPNRTDMLELDESCGLTASCVRTRQYRPEEFRLFAETFAAHADGWSLDEEPPILEGNGGRLIVPDYSFHRGGQTFHLELFHRWHQGGLEERLQENAGAWRDDLLIGVERALARQKSLATRLEQLSWFATRGLLFRDFPQPKAVVKQLNLLAKPT
ncbi:MAG: DUF790 family protein [Magnetococcus sp. WYHC-3]